MVRIEALTCLLALAAVAAPAQELSLDAASAQEKLAIVIAAAESSRGKDAAPVSTAFTDRELNAYFKAFGRTFLPDGIRDPQIGIGERGRVGARAIVDLDAVRRSRERGLLDPLAYLTGLLEVTAIGVLSGSKGVGLFRFESATIGGVSVPKQVLRELVRFYTSTSERPLGIDLDDSFALPANIQSVLLEHGQATIIQ